MESPLKLSVIMAAFNEERTVEAVVREVLDVDMPCEFEVIVVDDGSVDGTAQIVSAIADPRLRLIRHPTNLGKGTALRTGLRHATGTHLVPFDADGEYLASDLAKVVEPVLHGGHDVVIGTRAGSPPDAYGSLRYYVGNRVLTKVADVAFHSHLSDLHSCLKLVSTDLLRTLPLGETGFGADTEIVASLLRRGIEPWEVPISYRGRSRAEGKKIGWQDAVECVNIIGRIRMAPPRRVPQTRLVLDLTDSKGAPPGKPGP
jgi:glycosyltransferase involved in cell wall biosynthesis